MLATAQLVENTGVIGWSFIMPRQRTKPVCPITGSQSPESKVSICSDSGTESIFDIYRDTTCVTDVAHVTADTPSPALSRIHFDGCCISPVQPRGSLSEHVLAYLAKAESKEVLAHEQDDVRIAWLTVHFAEMGYNDPFGYAFWHYLGIHHSKWLKIRAERAEKHRLMDIPDYDPNLDKEKHGNNNRNDISSSPSGRQRHSRQTVERRKDSEPVRLDSISTPPAGESVDDPSGHCRQRGSNPKEPLCQFATVSEGTRLQAGSADESSLRVPEIVSGPATASLAIRVGQGAAPTAPKFYKKDTA